MKTKPRTARFMRFIDKGSENALFEDGLFYEFFRGPYKAKIIMAEDAIFLINRLLEKRIDENITKNDAAIASRYYNRFNQDEPFKKIACNAFIKKANKILEENKI